MASHRPLPRRILISGGRENFTILQFDTVRKTFFVRHTLKAPFNASWVECSSGPGGVKRFIGLSEEDDGGSLYTFEMNYSEKKCDITSQRPTSAAPCHFITLRDRSAIALATYVGGSLALYPASDGVVNGMMLSYHPQTEVTPPFPYASVGHGPNKDRQDSCHAHQVIEDKRGLLYVPDLGSDRVWIYQRHGLELQLKGWLQCPAGSGPRHGVLSHDGTLMYVIGELSHNVIAFDISNAPAEGIDPIAGFEQNVIHPSIKAHHQNAMDAAEICVHPTIPNVLYVSNRWARHIAEREPSLQDVPSKMPSGDDVAIILLSRDGREVQSISHVRTNVDVIRGMRVSDDGKYVVVAGQEGGGVEVYEITGERGEMWTRVVGYVVSPELESGIKHATWLS